MNYIFHWTRKPRTAFVKQHHDARPWRSFLVKLKSDSAGFEPLRDRWTGNVVNEEEVHCPTAAVPLLAARPCESQSYHTVAMEIIGRG
mmetsp:Transcript_34678/g.136709  ORF Transcript_34678/g.136709 Transcript_34678/m.136709 type:complete len:88 (+) Transcript_34678:4188-4451(+)